jgi:chromosome segregation ATPase
VKLKTLADLRERYPDEAPALEQLQGALEAEREQLVDGGEEADARLEEAARAIEAGEAEVEAWQFANGDFELVRSGLERAYRRGSDRFQDVRDDPSDEAVHEWRKRVKDLWYDLRVLRNVWPGEMKATADEAHDLSDLLGDHHDLAVLIETANASAPDDPEVAALETLARRRQQELLADALPLGERLYAEKPKRFAGRVATYWHAWRPNGDG